MGGVVKREMKAGVRYHVWWIDSEGRRRWKAAGPNRDVAEEYLRHIMRHVDRVRLGLVDPTEERRRLSGLRPLADHLAEYRAALTDRGRTAAHIQKSTRLLEILFEAMGAARLSDLTSASVEAALARLGRERGVSMPKAIHASLVGLTRWCVQTDRLHADRDPTRRIRLARAPEVRRRRALTAAEATALLDAAGAGPTRRGLAGPDRRALYALALGTGLRASECLSLTPASFDWTATPPRVRIEAEARGNKSRKAGRIDLAEWVARELRAWVQARDPSKPLWVIRSDVLARMMKADLAQAGIAARTTDGVIDFHALRTTYITWTTATTRDLATLQARSRHADPATTLRHYARTDPARLAQAARDLPDPTRSTPGPDDQ